MLGGELVDLEDFLAQRALLAAGSAGTGLVLDDDVEALAEGLDGFGKAELLGLAHEGDEVAGFAAAEALEEALVGIHIERRRLLVVERAQALQPAGAGLFQGDDPRNDIREVHAQLQVADAGGFDDGHGAVEGGAADRTPP